VNLRSKFSFFKTAVQAIRKYGVWPTFVISWYEFIYEAKFRSRTHHRIDPEEMDVHDAVSDHSEPYLPSAYYSAKRAFDQIHIKYENCSFVDYGCGLGRMLFFASQFPFRKIIGVEASEQMIQQAKISLTGYYRRKRKFAPEWTIEKKDVRQFKVPSDARVFYFYDPFGPAVMKPVLDRIVRSVSRYPRKNFPDLPSSCSTPFI
jgi:SAM-dependent methyltransferase